MFVSDELIRAETLAMSKEMSANRIYALDEIINGKADIVIANISSVLRYLPQVELFKSHCFKFKVGQTVNFKDLKECLKGIFSKLHNELKDRMA